MKKKIIISLIIIIILIIPIIILNNKTNKKEVVIKEIKTNKKNNKYPVESDNMNELLVDNIKEEVKEKIVIEERKVKYISKENKFKYITTNYDNINEYIKEEVKEEERIKYVCITNSNFKEENGKKYYYENGNKIKGLKLIDGVRYYFDFEDGELIKEDVKSVIDISSWQGDIDFEKVKNSNEVDHVIVRIGYGTTLNDNAVLDSKFERNINELRRLNIPYSIYIYGYAQDINASNIEVNFIDNIFNKYNISKDTYIWYDAELNIFDNFYYSKLIYNTVINNFIYKLNEKGYKNVGLYGNLSMLTNGSLSFLKDYPVWVAQYYTRCEYNENYIGWQYTSKGIIDGINGYVDMNIFY